MDAQSQRAAGNVFNLYRTNSRNTHLTAGATFHLSWMCLSGRARQVQEEKNPPSPPAPDPAPSRLKDAACAPAQGCTQITDNHMSEASDAVLHVGKRSERNPIGSGCPRGISELRGPTAESVTKHQSLYSRDMWTM